MEKLSEKLSGVQIIDIIQDKISSTEFANEDFNSDELGLGNCKLISSQTGDIDNTSYAHKVFLFEDHNAYIKIRGWYSSYSGMCEWDDSDYLVVEPKEKTITIWE